MPAIRRDLFFRILTDRMDDKILLLIAEELNLAVDQRLKNLDDLKTLFLSRLPDELVEQFLS